MKPDYQRLPMYWLNSPPGKPCPESGCALGDTRQPGDRFACILCGRQVVAVVLGEHVCVSYHRVALT